MSIYVRIHFIHMCIHVYTVYMLNNVYTHIYIDSGSIVRVSVELTGIRLGSHPIRFGQARGENEVCEPRHRCTLSH